MRRILLTLLVAVSSLLAAAPASHVHADTAPVYYLALGDSLARGYQPNHDVTHGYAQDLYHMLVQTTTNLQLVNLGCVDESTDTMLGTNGTYCPSWIYTTGMTTTPQITQAVTFLQTHPGQIKLITIDIGVNDVLRAIQSGLTLPKVLALARQLSRNLDLIYAQVRQAAGPNVKIVTMTYYNPLIILSDSALMKLGAALLNGIIASAAAKQSMTVAQVYQAFNGAPKPGDMICKKTWFCSLLHFGDPHPRRSGYTLIADAFLQAGAGNT